MASLLGRVVVVAGDDARLAGAADYAQSSGARVAVVSRALDGATPATVRFNADACDPDSWERIAMHIEQHLGPVDAVVADERSAQVVDGVFGPDLARRGHGAVLTLAPRDDEETVVTHLADMLRAGRPRQHPDAPGR